MTYCSGCYDDHHGNSYCERCYNNHEETVVKQPLNDLFTPFRAKGSTEAVSVHSLGPKTADGWRLLGFVRHGDETLAVVEQDPKEELTKLQLESKTLHAQAREHESLRSKAERELHEMKSMFDESQESHQRTHDTLMESLKEIREAKGQAQRYEDDLAKLRQELGDARMREILEAT